MKCGQVKSSYYAPKSLKQSVARYAPQFSGYSQQDSQEFMSFLLDGLHEDLNLIKQKPYMDKKDDDGKADDVNISWWTMGLLSKTKSIKNSWYISWTNQICCTMSWHVKQKDVHLIQFVF